MIYYCCRELGIDWRTTKYSLLGDDICISDQRVADAYMSLLSSLGVEYSKEKTIRSLHLIEFAKRLFYKGNEITPFPVSSIKESIKSYYVLTALLIDYSSKGWITRIGVPSSVSDFYGIYLNRPSRFRKTILERATFSERVMLITRGAIQAGETLTSLARQYGYPELVFNDSVGNSILQNITVQLFTESNPENMSTTNRLCMGLGPMAISLVETFSGL